MLPSDARSLAEFVYSSAVPALRVLGLIKDRGKWLRRMRDTTDKRYGPWWYGQFEIVDRIAWKKSKASLYFVGGDDGEIRYVGESGNRFADRWRDSPALDERTKKPLAEKQIFHNECWPAIEVEAEHAPSFPYEVRVIPVLALEDTLTNWGGPALPGVPRTVGSDAFSYVKDVERAFRQYRAGKCLSVGRLFCWNAK